MNRQCVDLFGISEDDAWVILQSVFDINNLAVQSYYAFPYTFGNIEGPLLRRNNTITGQAMTTYTIEAWSDGRHSILFCRGIVIDVRCDVNGFSADSVRI